MTCRQCGGEMQELAVQFVDGAPFHEDVCWQCRTVQVGSRLPVAQRITEVAAVSAQVESDLAAVKAAVNPNRQLEFEIADLERQVAEAKRRVAEQREQSLYVKPAPMTKELMKELLEARERRRTSAELETALGQLGGVSPEALAHMIVRDAYAARQRHTAPRARSEVMARQDAVVADRKAAEKAAMEQSSAAHLRWTALRGIEMT